MNPIRSGVAAMMAAGFFGIPSAAAADCTTNIAQLCDASEKAKLDRAFGSYGDVALIGLGLVAAVFLLVVLGWLLRKPHSGPSLQISTASNGIREIPSGGAAEFPIQVENRRKKTSVDVIVEASKLPAGWSVATRGTRVHESGFVVSPAPRSDGAFHLTSVQRGGHKGTLAVTLTAPAGPTADETVDVRMRVVPVVRGFARRRKGRKVDFTLLLTSRRSAVQIARVEHAPPAPHPGHPVVTRAWLVNGSDADSSNVAVNFSLNEQTVEHKVVPTLPPHQETVVEFQWMPTVGENRIRINIV